MATLLDDAFSHHAWANRRLLDSCLMLSPAQLATPVPGTYGSILETFRHLVDSDRWYLRSFRESPGADGPNIDDLDLAGLGAVIAESERAWAAVLATPVDPEAPQVEADETGEFHVRTGVRLAQAIHHGTDHRSQICTALTALGIIPPEIDLWAFAEATGRSWTVAVAGDETARR